MKKVILAALAVCAIFASCSKDEGSNASDKISLYVQFSNNVTNRAVDAPETTGTKTTINDAILFFLSGSQVVGTAELTAADVTDGKTFPDVSGSVDNVYVVGNVPSGDNASVKALGTISAIKNYAYTIEHQSTTASIQNKTHMGGANTVEVSPATSTDNAVYSATVDIRSITARFEFGGIVAGEGIKSIKLEGVWMNYYPATYTNAVASSPILVQNGSDSPYWATPVANVVGAANSLASPTNFVDPYSSEFYFDKGSSLVTAETTTANAYAYHLFAGAYVPHVIFLVSGEYEPNYYEQSADGPFFLGWVTFKGFTNKTSGSPINAVVGNDIYKSLGGITIPSSYLTDKPELNIDLNLTVNVVPWTEVNVTPNI